MKKFESSRFSPVIPQNFLFNAILFTVVFLTYTLTAGAAEIDSVVNKNYNGHRYVAILSNTVINWNQAKAAAEARGGHLVSIADDNENTAAYNLVSGNPNYVYGSYGPWIGGYELSENNWAWVDGTTYSYSNWNSGEPNNAGGENVIHFWAPTPGKWNDLADWRDNISYIMEYDYVFLPEVEINAITNILCTSSTSGGYITNDYPDDPVTESGLVYSSINATPTVGGANSTAIATNPNVALGSFSLDITGLTNNTTYYVRAYAKNGSGYAYSSVKSFTTVDEVPPSISVSVSPSTLWPPNHKMVDIEATVTVTDACGGDVTYWLKSITSNEPEEGQGNGDKDDDIQNESIGTADNEFSLRSERFGTGEGRTYTICYEAMDASGNTATACAEVVVPHDQGKLPVPGEYADGLQLVFSPNPFAETINIQYVITNDAYTEINIYNELGEKVANLVSSEMKEGSYSINWDGTTSNGAALTNGYYIIELVNGIDKLTGKIIMAR